MRKLKRSIAKANMRDAGFERLFKPKLVKGEAKRKSTFARHWKDWVAPTGNRKKALARARIKKAATRGAKRKAV